MTQVTIKGQTTINQVPTPRSCVKELFKAVEVEIPKALPYTGRRVYTRKKLTAERKAR